MERQTPDTPDAGRAQRLAGLRRSLVVALQAPAVAAGAMSEREAHRILVAVEERYATRAGRRLRPLAGSAV
jgi:hypothetical protein